MSQSAVRTGRPSYLQVLGFVWGHWRRQPIRLAVLTALMVLATACDVLLPLAAGGLIDVLAQGTDGPRARSEAFSAMGLLLVLAFAFFVMRNASLRIWIIFACLNMAAIVTESFSKVQRFSADWHANAFAGSTVRKLTRGMWAYDSLSDAVYVGIVPPMLVVLGVAGVMAFHWPLIGAFMLAASALYVAASLAMSLRYIAPANTISNDADSAIGAALADAVTCNATVRAFGAEPREDARIQDYAGDWRVKVQRTWTRYTDMWLAQSAALLVMQGGLIGLSVWQWSRGAATPGDVTFVISSFFVVSGYLRDLGENLQMLQRSINELADVVAFEREEPEIEDAPGAAALALASGRIAFENATFKYRGQDRPLYDGFSLEIGAGERIGLVGPSGSGKSTFVKLLMRFYDLDAGAVTIDGQNVAEVRQESLRRAIAIVPQDPALFHRSIADNIAYARPGASAAEIERAARRARAHEFIVKLPEGYDTLVGERGVKLSGGERQRIAIARAFLADAPILVLDEATSSLDVVTEAEVQEAMDELARGRTTIIIAHRLSSVREADRILVFDGGRIVEEGRHEDLVAREAGRYRQLYELQAAG